MRSLKSLFVVPESEAELLFSALIHFWSMFHVLNGLKSFHNHSKIIPIITTGHKMPFYAVARGRKPGIFNTWDECESQVRGFSSAKYKKFKTIDEAKSFVSGSNSNHLSNGTNEWSNGTSSQHTNHFVNELPSSISRNQVKMVETVATHIPFQGKNSIKRVKVEHVDDESVVIENRNAFNSSFIDDATKSVAVKVEDPDQIQVESVNVISPDDIFEPRNVFVVIEGHGKGIYRSMAEAWAQIDGRPNSFVKTFKDEEDAKFFLENVNGSNSNQKQEDTRQMNGHFNHIDVWTDGACESNGKSRAAGGIGVYFGPNDPRNISEPLLGRQTNNRAEIHAAIRAIQAAKNFGYTSVTIHTDSQFLINSITKWVPGWIRRDWNLASGGPVVNKNDFLELLEVKKGIDVRWVKVAGHSGDIGNEEADRLAREGISKPLVTSSSWINSDSFLRSAAVSC